MRFFSRSPIRILTIVCAIMFAIVPSLVSAATQSTPIRLGVPIGNISTVSSLAQYISVAYRYLIGVSVIAAIIMVMYGGFRYMLGSAMDSVKRGKQIMVDAIMGLIMILSAYVILQTVNPELTKLKEISIPSAVDDFASYDKTTEEAPPTGGPPAPAAVTAYEKLFQAYASCYGYDWRLLKAISNRESGLRETSITCQGPKPCQCGSHSKDKTKYNCYVSLFQFEAEGCGENTRNYPSSLGLACGTIENPSFDPEVSTAAGANRINKSLQQINTACNGQNMTVEDITYLLYTGHNNGPSVMKYVLQQGACKKDDQLEKVKEFYDHNPKTRAALDADYDKAMARAERKWNYSSKIVQDLAAYGVTSLYPDGAKNDTTCPKETGQRAYQKP